MKNDRGRTIESSKNCRHSIFIQNRFGVSSVTPTPADGDPRLNKIICKCFSINIIS